VGGIGGFRPAVVTLAGVLGLTAIAAGCSRPPRSAETDRIAKVVGDAISHPRQDSAAGFARAALATRAGRDGRLSVVAIEELQAHEPQEPLARLVFLVHLEESEGEFVTEPAVTACYEAKFNYYGIIGSPRRIACPRDAAPIAPPPTAPRPEIVIPDGADELVERLLTGAPRKPSAEEVRAAVAEGLGKAAADAPAGPQRVPPPPQVATDGADIGVALFEPDSRGCLLGARIDGEVLVWRPSRVQTQPGELSCDPGTALARQGTRAPH
jgi:hypothetical protein